MDNQNQIVRSTQDAMSISETFHKSGMFPDVKTAQQAFVKILAGQELGIPPFAAMSGIHIIQGRPTIGAGLMASRVKASGKYDYRIVEQSEKICSIDFYQAKEMIGNSSFTIEESRKAQTKNMDKFPKNMLFARALSNGVKWFTPDIFNGPVYVPEEMNHVVTEEAKAEVIETKVPSTTMEEILATLATITTVEGLKDFFNESPRNKEEDAKKAIEARKIEIQVTQMNNAKTIDELESMRKSLHKSLAQDFEDLLTALNNKATEAKENTAPTPVTNSIQDQLKEAIDKLKDLHTTDEIKAFEKDLGTTISKMVSFKDAAKARIEEIKNEVNQTA